MYLKRLIPVILALSISAMAQTKTFVTYTPVWSGFTSYAVNDMVTVGTGSLLVTYISLIPNNQNNAPASTVGTDWNIVGSASMSGGGGSVTNFSAGALSPLFTTSVANATTTPALTFTISNAAQNSVLAGPATGGAGAYSFQTAPTFSAANLTSFPTFNQSTTGNAATATALAATPTLCTTGSAPTGVLANGNATGCAIIGGGSGTVTTVSVTTANGVSGTVATATTTPAITLTLGAITPTSTNGVSAATMAFMDATSSVQTQLNAKAPLASPALTGVPTAPTATVGTNTTQIATTAFVLANAGSGAVSSVSNSDGTLTISPTTGAVVASLALGHANTWSGQQTFVAPILGTPASGVITNLTGTCASCSVGGNAATATSVNFSGVASGTNTTGLVVGSGGVLSFSGTGFINANEINGVALSGLATGLYKNTTTTGVPVIATAGTDYVLPTGNISGTAANLSGTPALPNGTTATTQTTGDATTNLATDAFVAAATAAIAPASVTGLRQGNGASPDTAATFPQVQTAGTNPLTVTAEFAFNTGSGTTIPDITGNGHDATFCTSTHLPTWTAEGVQFNSNASAQTDYHCATTNLTNWKSIAITFELPTPVASGTGNGVQAPANGMAAWGTTTNDGYEMRGSGGIWAMPTRLTASATTTGAPVNSGFQYYSGRHTLVIVPTLTSSPNQYYLDGVLILPLNSGNGATPTNTPISGVYQFGAGFNNTATGFVGTILYATVDQTNSWTAAQVLAETQYHQAKVSSRPLTNFNITGAATTNTIIVDGDSINAGRLGTAQFTTLLSLTNTYTVSNVAVSSTHMEDINGYFAQEVLPLINPTGKNYCITNGGANNSYNSLFIPFLIAYAKQAKQANCIPIYSTGTDTSAGNSNIAGTAATVRANWKAWGYAAIEDDFERPEFAVGASSNTTYYQSDQTHLTGPSASCGTATGYALRCRGMSKIVNTLDGSNSANPDQSANNAVTETDANTYMVQTPTGAATNQIPDCSWITGQTHTIINGSTSFTITVSVAAEVVSGVSGTAPIIGSNLIAPGNIAVFTSTVNSPTAGACSWTRTQ